MFVIGLALFFGMAFFTFKPVPIPDEGDCLIAKGVVAQIQESGTNDISIRLKGNDRIFYINRGLEREIDLKELRAALIDKEILIKYPSYWTPLDPGDKIRHISKVELSGHTIFTEL